MAESIAVTSDQIYANDKLRVSKIEITCHTDGSLTATRLKDITGWMIPSQHVQGWWLASIFYEYGATGPTDNSDLYLYRDTASRMDVLGGGGANAIDNATDNLITPATVSPILTGREILTLANNSENGATFSLIFNLYRD